MPVIIRGLSKQSLKADKFSENLPDMAMILVD